MKQKKQKKYVLSVDIIVDGKKVTIGLAGYDLIALQKYTAFCNGPEDLLKFMPNDDDFSVRNFLSKHLSLSFNKGNDPFSIRTSDSKQAKKLRIIYKEDVDVLIAGKKSLSSRLYELVRLSIDDCVNNNISEEKKALLKYLYDKYYGPCLDKEIQKEINNHYNMDYEYDERYKIPYHNRWMFIALSHKCAEALIFDAFKDDRKRIELAFLLKDKTGDLLPTVSGEQKDAMIEKLDLSLRRRQSSPSYIRTSIKKSVRRFNNKIEPKEKPKVVASVVTERKIIEYNKSFLKENYDCKLEEIIFLSEKIETLKLSLEASYNEVKKLEELLQHGSFLESDESIKRRLELAKDNVNTIKQKIRELEYELNELESDRVIYSDAGFVVEKDKGI